MVVVLFAIVPAHADTPRPGPAPVPGAAPAPGAAPVPAPAPKSLPKVLPLASLQDVLPWVPNPPDQPTGAPSFGGGFSSGLVIEPPPHLDARPWPDGIVIEPPDVKDPIAIGLGTRSLARAPGTWADRLTGALLGGLGTILGELLVPKTL